MFTLLRIIMPQILKAELVELVRVLCTFKIVQLLMSGFIYTEII